MFGLKYLAILIVIAVIASACMPIEAQDSAQTVEVAVVGYGADAAAYAQRGPHATGYTPLLIGDGSEQSLDAGLWYPATNAEGTVEAVTYDVAIKMTEMQSDSPSIVYGQALLDAPIDSMAGSYPLVIFSHGFGLNVASYHTLPEHYASHGFVVLAPEHLEDDWFNGVAPAMDRPLDIKQTLDFAEELNAPGGELAGLIDMENVAVVGHSYGGYTALAAAGARIDFAAFTERCAALAADDPKMFLCMPLLGKESEMAARAGLDTVPEGLWPSSGDPRVKAIVPMAGDAFLFDKAGLSNITVPMMAIGGTADTGTPYDWGSKLSYDSAASAQKSLVGLEGAEHMIAGSPCEDMPWIADSPYADYLCVDPAWDKKHALDLIHHFSTAFLLHTLRGDAAAHAMLLPGAVQFNGIDYETTLN